HPAGAIYFNWKYLNLFLRKICVRFQPYLSETRRSMKTNRMLFSAVILLALTLPAIAQERGQPAAEERGSRSIGGDSGATSSMGSRGISVGDSSGMSTSSPRMSRGTAGTVANFPNSSIYSGNANSAAPNFSGTSYYSYDTYYQMENFLWY